MSFSILEGLVLSLGIACLAWGAFALRYPRYSFIGARVPRSAVESDEQRLHSADPVSWRGWGTEDEQFEVGAQRRAGALVAFAGGVLCWIVLL
ncbi:MAG: hypothetical protein ABEJ35_02145 [Halobacteriaceae archaeon]